MNLYDKIMEPYIESGKIFSLMNFLNNLCNEIGIAILPAAFIAGFITGILAGLTISTPKLIYLYIKSKL